MFGEKEEKKTVCEFTDNAGDKNAVASRFILSAYLFNKPFAKETDISDVEFTLPVHKEIQKYIVDKLSNGEAVRFNDLYEFIPEQLNEEVSRIAGMETEESKAFDKATYFFDCIRTLKSEKINREIDRLTELFSAETDTEKRKSFTMEMAKLIAEKSKLK